MGNRGQFAGAFAASLREGILLCPNKNSSASQEISSKTDLPALKLTACSEKKIDGSNPTCFPIFGARPIFKGSASFNEGICTLWFLSYLSLL